MEEVLDIGVKEVATVIILKDVKNGASYGIHYVLRDFMPLDAVYAHLNV